MAWDKSKSGHCYFTSTHRLGGRFVRRYWGRGPIGELAATLFAQRRLEREQQKRRDRDERERLRETQAPLVELCQVTGLLMRASLLAAGYHQHDRGEWRRRTEMTADVSAPAMTLAGPGDLTELAERVQ